MIFREIQMKYLQDYESEVHDGCIYWEDGGRGTEGQFFAGFGWFVSFMSSELAQIIRASANRQTGTVNWTPIFLDVDNTADSVRIWEHRVEFENRSGLKRRSE